MTFVIQKLIKNYTLFLSPIIYNKNLSKITIWREKAMVTLSFFKSEVFDLAWIVILASDNFRFNKNTAYSARLVLRKLKKGLSKYADKKIIQNYIDEISGKWFPEEPKKAAKK